MRRASVTRRVMAVSLALMLGACGATPTRPSLAGPTGPHDLVRYALVFEQRPDGQVAHAWIPLREFELTKFQHTLSTRHTRRNLVRVSSSALNAYCDGRHDQCVKDCLASSRPFVIGHRKFMDTQARPWRIARSWWCPSNCMEALIECKKGRGEWAEQYAAEFDAIDPAIEWIKRHRTEFVVGAVVVIAGVAFAVVVAGSGGAALVLAPLLVMAESFPALPPDIQIAEACR
ncbi:hypothetical protein [Myxococcus sp. AM011]|uniref:hypothetical protein n=1 Tax=Myxococcus sp. AM011 TaxID=2745200 RepID=UPI0020CD4ADE|nr:hypothetical protein [Myxococcus sp. AM011]